MYPPPLGFVVLQYFEKVLTLVESCDVIYKVGHILWVAALLGSCDAIQNGH